MKSVNQLNSGWCHTVINSHFHIVYIIFIIIYIYIHTYILYIYMYILVDVLLSGTVYLYL